MKVMDFLLYIAVVVRYFLSYDGLYSRVDGCAFMINSQNGKKKKVASF